MADALPPRLREEVARTLRPVRPLVSPLRRAAALAPVAGLLLVCVPLLWQLREDAAALGPVRLWGGSLLQDAVAVLLLAAAFAESIPGRLSAPRSLLLRAFAGVAFMVALTLTTFAASPTHVPLQQETHYTHVCLTRSFALGLVPLGVTALLLCRGLLARPITAGALAGLGAGLLADSSWRLFCEVSDPAHVLTVHAGAVAGVAVVGAAAGALSRLWSRGGGG